MPSSINRWENIQVWQTYITERDLTIYVNSRHSLLSGSASPKQDNINWRCSGFLCMPSHCHSGLLWFLSATTEQFGHSIQPMVSILMTSEIFYYVSFCSNNRPVQNINTGKVKNRLNVTDVRKNTLFCKSLVASQYCGVYLWCVTLQASRINNSSTNNLGILIKLNYFLKRIIFFKFFFLKNK